MNTYLSIYAVLSDLSYIGFLFSYISNRITKRFENKFNIYISSINNNELNVLVHVHLFKYMFLVAKRVLFKAVPVAITIQSNSPLFNDSIVLCI